MRLTLKQRKRKGRSFPTIAAAAAKLGVSEAILKNAKRMGCDAFATRGSVSEKPLLKFIAEHGAELNSGGVALRDRKIEEEIRKLKIRNDLDAGKLIAIDRVREINGRILAAVDAILEQKLSNEYPSIVAGLEVPQARVYGKRLGDSIREEFQKLNKEWN